MGAAPLARWVLALADCCALTARFNHTRCCELSKAARQGGLLGTHTTAAALVQPGCLLRSIPHKGMGGTAR